MVTVCLTPIRIYNSSDKRSTPKFKSRNKKYQVIETVKLDDMRCQIAKYKRAEKKIKLLTSWGLRATESSLSDLRGILETLDELYGDDAFDEDV